MKNVHHDDEVITRGILREELRHFATKDDFSNLKGDVSSLKDMIVEWRAELPTKQDLAVWKDEVVTILKNERLEDSAVLADHQEYEEKLKDHGKRIKILESK